MLPARGLHHDEFETVDVREQILAIKKNPMLGFAVLIESLAVIGYQHDHRAVVDFFLLQEIDELSEDRIGRRDLAVVRKRKLAA